MTIYPVLPQTITLFHFNFYTYGLIVGLATVVGLSLAEKKAKQLDINLKLFWQTVGVMFVGGLVGARLWHVFTDWSLYKDNLIKVFNLRTGGLSILGVIAGSLLALFIFNFARQKRKKPAIKFSLALDIVALVLPISQAIGRLGNFANQELYGYPVLETFWLKLYVAPEYRLPTYKLFSYYHPLFFYEIVGLILLTFLIYWLERKHRFFHLGQGRLFLVYLTGYAWLRFGLEFFRLEKTLLPFGLYQDVFLGVNQTIMFFVGVCSSFWLIFLWYQHLKRKR